MQSPKFLFLALCFCSAFGSDSAVAEVRRFTLNSGQVIEAELVDVKPGSVTLRVEGNEAGMAERDFSLADRRYFRSWLRSKRGLFDWPGERGYRSDGTTEEVLPAGEPTVLWKAEVGAGHSAVILGGDAAYTTGIRGGKFVIAALRLESGREIWQQSYPTRAGAGRAVASPAIDAEMGLLYTMGPQGRIDAWRLKGGANVWATELPRKYPDAILPRDGLFASPVIGSHLYFEVGGPSYSLVGLAGSNGSESWHIGKHRSIGATPVLAEIGKRKLLVSRNDYGLVARRIETGTMAWDQAWQGGGRASPVVVGNDRVFVTAENMCAMFRIEGDRTVKVWSNSNLCSPASSPIFHDGFLYGFNGGALTCINAESGGVAWSKKELKGGGLILAGDKLLIQTRDSGELVIAAADPRKFIELSRTKVFDAESDTIPVLANGRIFCRSMAGDVTCLELRESE